MLQQLKKRNSGFTIIEVLIVLAIAGLIMVVVFLAVPNLQRNARNNAIKTDANNLLAAYQEVSDQKNGAVLTNANSQADAANVKSAANTSRITTVTIQAGGSVTLGSTKADTATATFVTGEVCQSDPTLAPTATNATTRSVSLVYTIETASGVVSQCING